MGAEILNDVTYQNQSVFKDLAEKCKEDRIQESIPGVPKEKSSTRAETSPTPVETDTPVTNGEAEGQLTVTAKPKWSDVFLGYACDQGRLRSRRCKSPRCPKIHRKGKRNGPKCDQCGGFRRCPLQNPISWAICPSNFHESGYYTPGHSNNQGAGFAGIFENALFG